DTSRQTKNLNKLLIRILLHLQVEFSSEQTILLCTTSEIRKDKDFPKLEPFASRLYTLTRDPEAQSTYVNEGYFGIQINE
ncbi:hypothetical protein, partial [Bacteroides uniformis]|uniref:hypothetical protein n=1 Tax=Bacteroides uniformis TaxID=820 RepID=UPI0039B69067